MAVIRRSPLRRRIGAGGSGSSTYADQQRKRIIRCILYPPTLAAILVGALFIAARRQREVLVRTDVLVDTKTVSIKNTKADGVNKRVKKNTASNARAERIDGAASDAGGGLRATLHHETAVIEKNVESVEPEDKPEDPSPDYPAAPAAPEAEEKEGSEGRQPNVDDEQQVSEVPNVTSGTTNPPDRIPESVEGWPSECALYLAESTIPSSGLGMFTALDLPKGAVAGSPDITIPVLDINWHNQNFYQLSAGYHLLYENYFWMAQGLNMGGIAENVGVMSHGFGALVNSHQGLLNLDEGKPTYDDGGLHRGKDPGAGAFSPYHGRNSYTTTAIPAGAELFVDYGPNWFTSRTDEIGYVPLGSDYNKADKFVKAYHIFATDKLRDTANSTEEDFWGLIRNFQNHSRSLNALPITTKDANVALKVGVRSLIREIRSPEWLKENGKCLDNIQPQPSTITQAGRGAFATRFMPKESLVIAAPLIHIPRGRDVFRMYEMNATNAKGEYVHNRTKPTGYQLMMNYAFGHPDSSVLLSPYGPCVSFINHASGDKANVRLQWAEPSHEWLNKSVNWLERNTKNAQLSFDFIATRDIQPGEEIFLDYGAEWQKAWTEHVNNWSPGINSDGYVSARDLNTDAEDQHLVLRTSKEQESDPYPNTVQTNCRYRAASKDKAEKYHGKEETKIWDASHANAKLQPCEILSKLATRTGEYLYEVRILERMGRLGIYGKAEKIPGVPKGQKVIIKSVPREAIEFGDKMYSTDILLANAFRHEIVVSDDIWPESWKNLKPT